ncbi:MAG: TIR domain-containing protein [Anaerolineales bacterium]|nr:TIR domain-containing protein [Anaerolineales bacterium]
MAKIFVSYSRKDSKYARNLINSIKELKHDPWVDWEDIPPATNWMDQIESGIEKSDAFIFCISPDSVASEVCNVELSHAAKYNKRIIPIVLREVPAKDTNNIIRQLNWIFLREEDDLQSALGRLKDAVELDFVWLAEHNRLLEKTLDWHHGKTNSLLLRGSELHRVQKVVAEAKGKEPFLTPLQEKFLENSIQNERRTYFLGMIVGIVLTILAGLTVFALVQRNLAKFNEREATKQAAIASENALVALKNEREARKAQQEAEDQRQIAEEQRSIADDQRKVAEERARFALAQQSAARAQIYQSQPGELYTSTLLAINSWQTAPSSEAEEILRKNISLLPIPVKQTQRDGKINSLEFDRQGDMFVTGGADGNACVWKASDGEMQFCVTSSGAVNDAVFSPNGKLLVTGDMTGLVQIIRIEDQNVLATYKAGAIVWDVDIRKAGDQIAVTRDDGRITLLDTATGKRKYDLQASGRLKIASFSPDGRYIAVGSSIGAVTLWNLDDGKAVSSGRHKGEVLALVFSPDSKYLVTGGADSMAVAAKTIDGQEVYRLLHEDWVQDIAFNPDNSWFATVSNDRRIRLWDTADGDERLRMSQNSFVKQVKVSANGQWLATTGADKTVRVWNASTGTEMFQIPLKGEGTVVGFSADGTRLVEGDTTGELNVWDISVMPAPENYLQFPGLVGDVHYSPSGDWMAASDGPRVWLLQPGQLSTLTSRSLGRPTLEVNGNVMAMEFSPDSTWLGISTDTGNVTVYQIKNRSSQTFTTSGGDHEIAFTSDNTRLLVGQPGWSVDAWDLKTREQLVAFAGGQQEVMSFAVGPSMIALGLTDKVTILNDAGEKVQEIDSPGEHSLLMFSSDGSLLASSNSAGLVNLWKNTNGKFVFVDSIRKDAVYSMTFNPAGNRLAVGATNAVYLIDTATVDEVARIPHAGKVDGVSYSIGGQIMATASLKAIQFWDVTKIENVQADALIPTACSRLTANFSEAQWSNLFGSEPYRKLCEALP